MSTTVGTALTVSTVGVASAITLEAAGLAPRPVIVLAVMVVGFAASWVRSGSAPQH